MKNEKLKTYLQRCNIQCPKTLKNGFTLLVIQECFSETKSYFFENYEEFSRLVDVLDCKVDKLIHVDTVVGTNSMPFIWSKE